ncbi:MAG: Ig-like domain-containing protein [Burkholderiaceae bacterium]|nr:Ig-like domain-containing protein [Burkholderiaceae bacterium]
MSRHFTPATFARRHTLAALAALLAACGGGGTSGPAPLTLASSMPADGATDVARTEPVRLTFSAALDASTVNTANLSLREQDGATTVATMLSASGATVTMTPSGRLQPLTRYVVQFGTGLRGSGSEALAAAGSIAFTTADRAWLAASLVENDDTSSAAAPHAFGLGNTVHAVWQQSDGSVTSIRYAAHNGSGWTAPVRLRAEFLSEFPTQPNTYPALAPRVLADAEGNLFALWSQQDVATTSSGSIYPRRVWVARRAAGSSTWSTPQSLSRNAMPDTLWGGLGTSAATLHPTEGHAMAVWTHLEGGRNRIYGARYTRSSGWTAAELVDQMAIGGESRGLAAAAAPGGRFVLAWVESSEGFESRVWLRVYQPGSGWGTSFQVGNSGAPLPAAALSRLVLAIAPDGKGWLVYRHYDGARGTVFAAPVDATAAVAVTGAPQPISTDPTRDAAVSTAAINAAGDLVAVWNDVEGDLTDYQTRLFGRVRMAATGQWQGAQSLDTIVRSAGVGIGTVPEAEIDARGRAIVLWTKMLPDRTQRALAARFDARAWRPTAELASLPQPPEGIPSPPSRALGAFGDGRAVAIWQRWDGGRADLWARLFD